MFCDRRLFGGAFSSHDATGCGSLFYRGNAELFPVKMSERVGKFTQSHNEWTFSDSPKIDGVFPRKKTCSIVVFAANTRCEFSESILPPGFRTSQSPPMNTHLNTILATSIAALFTITPAYAVNVFWDTNGATPGSSAGATANGTWDANSVGNWSTDPNGAISTTSYATAHGGAPATADVFFSAGGNATGLSTITITAIANAGVVANSITIEDGSIATATSGTFSAGPVLTLGAGGLTIAATAAGPSSFNSNTTVALSANQTWTNNGANLFTASGALTGTAATGNSRSFTLAPTAAGAITLGGVLGNGVLGGNLALVAGGAGTTTLSGANVFTGGLAGATLTATVANALGSNATSAPVVVNNGTLNLAVGNVTHTGLSTGLSGNGIVNVTLGTGSNTNFLNGNFSGFTGVWNVGIGAAAGAGKVQMNGADNAAATINVLANATVFVSGSVLPQPHNAALVLNGGDTGEALGQLRLDANATWAGPITLAGDLTTPTVDSTIGSGGGNGFVTGAIGETGGPRALVKGGPGFITLSGANTFTGRTSVIGGQLIVGSLNRVAGGTASSHLGAPTTVANGTIDLGSVASTGQLVYTGAGETTDRVVNLAGTTGSGTLNQMGLSGNLKFTSDLTATGAGAKLLILQGTTAGTGEIAGAIVNSTAATSLQKFGTGTWTLSGTNSFTGGTTLSGGTLRLDYGANDTTKLADTVALTFSGGALELAGGTHTEVVSATTLTAGTNNTIARSSGGAVIALNAITPNTGASLTFTASGAATTDTLNTNGILGFWARTNIGGVSSWAANSTNAADGAIIPYAGYADITRLGASAIPNAATNNVRVINGGASGNITLAGGALTQAYTLQMDASDGAATIAPTTPTDVLNLGNDAGGAIWQTATSGALTLGTLPNDGVLTSGATASAAAATLRLINDHPANVLTINSLIANNGSDVVNVTKSGAGTVLLAGNNTFTGALTAGTGGMLILSGNNSARPAGTSNLNTVNAGGILQLQANAGNTTAGVSTVLSIEQTANQPLIVASGGTLQLRGDDHVTFAGGNNFGGLGNATVTIDVNQLTAAGTGKTLTLAPGGFNVNTTTINVTGGNGYALSTGTITNTTGANGANVNLTPTSGSLIVAGYTGTTAFTSTLNLNGTATGNMVTGPITNATSAIVSLTKAGTGAWESAGANTFTGTTSVREGTLTLSGNRTVAAGGITVADSTGFNATLNITNGSFALGASFFLSTTTNVATVNHSGGAIAATGGNFVLIGNGVGSGSQGIYNLSGGTLSTGASAARGVTLGVNTGTTGTFNLSGTGNLSLPTSTLMVARSDDPVTNNSTGIFTQTGGTATIGTLSIGGGNASTLGNAGTVNLTGGIFTATNFTVLAASPASSAAITIGGSAQVTLPAFPTARGGGSTATLTFDGGTLIPAAASTAYLSGLTNAFIKNGGAKIDVPAGRDSNITQALENFPTHTGALTKLGAGALRLAGVQTYSILNANEGTTNLKSALGTGGSTLNANASVNIGADQTLAALNIGDGAVVTLDSALAAPTPGAPLDAEFGADTVGSSAQAVPEPGSAALLLGGMLTLLGLRRRAGS